MNIQVKRLREYSKALARLGVWSNLKNSGFLLFVFIAGCAKTRPSELRVEDITEIEGIKIFQICHNPEKKQTTKTKESRISPMHPILEQIGFMAFVVATKVKKSGLAIFEPSRL